MITIWLFSLPDSQAATAAAIAALAPTFAALALTAWQVIAERDNDLASRASELAKAVASEWEGHRLALLGNYSLPADIEFSRVKTGALARYRTAAGPRSGRMTELLGFFSGLRPSRLVIVGAAGSGKTMLAVELLIALLADRDGSEEPSRREVPVLLSLSSWDTRRTLQEWITSHLASTYQIRERTARRLVDGHWVMPVLDEMDEMDADSAKDAVRQLNTHASFSLPGPLVLTCREEQYLELAEHHALGLQDAAVVRIRPLSADQIATYLSHRYPAHSRQRKPDDPWSKVRQHVKRHPRSALAGALSTPWRLMLTTAACDAGQLSPASLLTYHAAGDLDSELLRRFVPSAVAISMPRASEAEAAERARAAERRLGRLAAMLDRAGADIILQDLWKARARKKARLLHAVVSVPGSALVWLLGAETASGAEGLAFACLCMTIAIAFGTWAAVDSDPRPSRISLRRLRDWRYSLPACAVGLTVGSYSVYKAGWKIGFTVLVFTTLAALVFTGLRQGAPETALPGDPLKDDLVFGITLGLIGGAWAGLPGGLSGGLLDTIGIERATGLWPSVLLALALGIAAGISIGSRAWLRYVMALTLEALPGRLPWRLNGFLRWSYQAGLLRVSGLAYQFRHDELRIWLRERHEAGPEP